jgi:replicative DNA helicase
VSQQSTEFRADQLAPHSVEAEEAVIGSGLIDPFAYSALADIISPADFFIERHCWAWEAMGDLHAQGIGIDYLTVQQRLAEQGRLAEFGGPAYLLSLVNRTPSSLNADGYARIVANMAYRRRLIDVMQLGARLAHSEQTSLVAIQDHISDALGKLGGRLINTHRSAKAVYEDFTQAFALRLANAADGGPAVGLDAGLPEWNAVFDGDFKPGSYVGVMGPTKIGKSWALMQMALAAATQLPVVFFSLENMEESVRERMIALDTGVPFSAIRRGLYLDKPMPQAMADRVFDSASRLAKLPIEFVTHLNSVKEIAAHIKAATVRHGEVGIAFVDTLNQLADSYVDDGKRYENLVRASGRLLQTMRATGWGIVTAVQMRIELQAGMSAARAKEVAYPTIHSVEGAKKIAQDASKLIGIYRADYIADQTRNPDFYDAECPAGMALFVDVAARDSEGTTDKLVAWNKSVPRYETGIRRIDFDDRAALGSTFVAHSAKEEA